jgi:DGQHR domain-containing protein
VDQVRVPVVRHFQKGRAVYVGTLTAALARKITFADHYPPAPGRSGYQRPPDPKRAQAFAQYVKKDPAGFMTPVLLNARTPMTFVPTDVADEVGHLLLEDGMSVVIVDGQHRILGVEAYLGNDDHPVPFMMFDHLDMESEQQLFITINREQKRVSMSHVHFVARGTDTMAEIVSRLESDPASPWYGRVNLIGAKGTKRPVSLQSLRAAQEALLQSGEVKYLPVADQYQIALSFWETVADIWPEAWGSVRGSLLTKSIGTLAVAKMGGYLLQRCLVQKNGRLSLNREKLAALLQRASEVNWMNDGPFQGYAGRHGADLVKNHLDSLIFRNGLSGE